MQMYRPRFPDNFPEDGTWKVTYFDENEIGYPLKTESMFVWEHMGQFKLLREKSLYGWKYAMGEMDKYLIFSEWKNAGYPFFNGQWRFYTNESRIHLVTAKKILEL